MLTAFLNWKKRGLLISSRKWLYSTCWSSCGGTLRENLFPMRLQFSRNLSLYFPRIVHRLRTLYCLFPQDNFLYLASYSFLYNNQINARALIGQSAMSYFAGKPMEKSRVFWRIRKPPACGSCFTHYSRVLPTSRVVYQPKTGHKNLWSIS